jgi:hypothetical protein
MAAGNPIVINSGLDTCLDNTLAYASPCFTPACENVILRDREFQTRPGLNPLGSNATEMVLGSIWLRNLTDVSQIVLGTTTNWRLFNNSTQLWVDISGGVPLTNSDLPITFTYFFQGGVQYVIGVNGTDPTKEFNLAGAAYANLANAPIARTVCTVAGRVFFGAIKVGGTLFPQTCQWSAAGQRTVYPALAKNDVADTSDHIVLVINLGRRAVAIMKEQSQHLALSQPGSDANAFEFQLLDYQPGPIGACRRRSRSGRPSDRITGIDFNLRAFDGVKGTVIKDTQKYLLGRLNFAARALTSVRYYPARQEIWCAVPLDTDTIPTHLLVYSYITGGVTLDRVPTDLPISHLGKFYAEFDTVTDALPDIPTDQLPDVPTDQLGISSRGETLLAGSSANVFSLEGQTDNGFNIVNDWQIALPVLPRQEYQFDGLEALFAPTTILPITISVRIGQTLETLTEMVLGYIIPRR